MPASAVDRPRIVSRAEWLTARKELLRKEKEHTRAYDELNRQRRELPWVKVEKRYVFDSEAGKVTLADLFDGRSQLIVYHFMFGPGWKEGCVGCSFGSDHADAALVHLHNHDVTYVSVSRAPLPEILAFKQRMGWRFNWVSSYKSDFNFDFQVSFTKEQAEVGQLQYNYADAQFESEEMSGTSVFAKDEEGNVYHTYSTFARGQEKTVSAYMLLDLTPKGRNEAGSLVDWVRHHDRYGARGYVDRKGRYVAAATECGCSN
jgi:predicted dithiol-disulfide oxidoreductase (DUF899 family)